SRRRADAASQQSAFFRRSARQRPQRRPAETQPEVVAESDGTGLAGPYERSHAMTRIEKSTIGRIEQASEAVTLRAPKPAAPAASPQPRARALPRELRWIAGALDLADRVVPPLAERWAARQFFTPRRTRLGDRSALMSARRIRIDGRELAAWRWGDGPAVLLVHGWEGHAGQLAAFVEPLLARGLSAVAFDAPAHGSSRGDHVTLFDFADAVADVAR